MRGQSGQYDDRWREGLKACLRLCRYLWAHRLVCKPSHFLLYKGRDTVVSKGFSAWHGQLTWGPSAKYGTDYLSSSLQKGPLPQTRKQRPACSHPA